MSEMHRIVIVGGGAGGLELATRVGDKLGRTGLAHITLIDKKRTHFWKPHLHEIAAGSVNLGMHELSYMAQGHWHCFTDRIGEMTGLDRKRRVVRVAPYLDARGQPVTPLREFAYDTLVIAVGSQVNDFGTPGVREHAIAMETPEDADAFHTRLVNACIRAHAQVEPLQPHQLQVAIIGAGATGVELAAELRHTTRELVSYGLDRIDHARHIGIHLIEAGPRVLPALPERFSQAAQYQMDALKVNVYTDARVSQLLPNAVILEDGRQIAAELVVWAAGVKAPEFLARLDGLETNRINQLVVTSTLQTTQDKNIFAIGDCAACPWLGREGILVPPRAQAAHQQASYLVDALQRQIKKQSLKPWHYRDFGSLVSLGRYKTVGNLIGGFGRGNLWLDTRLAWLMYISLYQLHQIALHGVGKVILDIIGKFISQRTRPRVKLH